MRAALRLSALLPLLALELCGQVPVISEVRPQLLGPGDLVQIEGANLGSVVAIEFSFVQQDGNVNISVVQSVPPFVNSGTVLETLVPALGGSPSFPPLNPAIDPRLGRLRLLTPIAASLQCDLTLTQFARDRLGTSGMGSISGAAGTPIPSISFPPSEPLPFDRSDPMALAGARIQLVGALPGAVGVLFVGTQVAQPQSNPSLFMLGGLLAVNPSRFAIEADPVSADGRTELLFGFPVELLPLPPVDIGLVWGTLHPGTGMMAISNSAFLTI